MAIYTGPPRTVDVLARAWALAAVAGAMALGATAFVDGALRAGIAVGAVGGAASIVACAWHLDERPHRRAAGQVQLGTRGRPSPAGAAARPGREGRRR